MISVLKRNEGEQIGLRDNSEQIAASGRRATWLNLEFAIALRSFEHPCRRRSG